MISSVGQNHISVDSNVLRLQEKNHEEGPSRTAMNAFHTSWRRGEKRPSILSLRTPRPPPSFHSTLYAAAGSPLVSGQVLFSAEKAATETIWLHPSHGTVWRPSPTVGGSSARTDPIHPPRVHEEKRHEHPLSCAGVPMQWRRVTEAKEVEERGTAGVQSHFASPPTSMRSTSLSLAAETPLWRATTERKGGEITPTDNVEEKVGRESSEGKEAGASSLLSASSPFAPAHKGISPLTPSPSFSSSFSPSAGMREHVIYIHVDPTPADESTVKREMNTLMMGSPEKRDDEEEAIMKIAEEEAAQVRRTKTGGTEKKKGQGWDEKKESIPRDGGGGVAVVQERSTTTRGTPINDPCHCLEKEDAMSRSPSTNPCGAEWMQRVRPSPKADIGSPQETRKDSRTPQSCTSSSPRREMSLSSAPRSRIVSGRMEQDNGPEGTSHLLLPSPFSGTPDGVGRGEAAERADWGVMAESEGLAHACTRAALRSAEARIRSLQQQVRLLSERGDSLAPASCCASRTNGDPRRMSFSARRRGEEEHAEDGLPNAREAKASFVKHSLQKSQDETPRMQGGRIASGITGQKRSAPSCGASPVEEENGICLQAEAGAPLVSITEGSPAFFDDEPCETHCGREEGDETWAKGAGEHQRGGQGTRPAGCVAHPHTSSLLSTHTGANDGSPMSEEIPKARPSLSAEGTPFLSPSMTVHEIPIENPGTDHPLHCRKTSFSLAEGKGVESGVSPQTDHTPFPQDVSSCSLRSPGWCEGIHDVPMPTGAVALPGTCSSYPVGEEESSAMQHDRNVFGALNRLTRDGACVVSPTNRILHASETETHPTLFCETLPTPFHTGERNSVAPTPRSFSSLQKSGATPTTPHDGCLCCRELLRALMDKERQLLQRAAECQYWKERCEKWEMKTPS